MNSLLNVGVMLKRYVVLSKKSSNFQNVNMQFQKEVTLKNATVKLSKRQNDVACKSQNVSPFGIRRTSETLCLSISMSGVV